MTYYPVNYSPGKAGKREKKQNKTESEEKRESEEETERTQEACKRALTTTKKLGMERVMSLSNHRKSNCAAFFYNIYISKAGYPSLNPSHRKMYCQ